MHSTHATCDMATKSDHSLSKSGQGMELKVRSASFLSFENRDWKEGVGKGAKELPANDIHKGMLPVIAENCVSRKAVHNWLNQFSQGRPQIDDEARSSRLVKIATEASAQGVEKMIQSDNDQLKF